MNELLQKHGCSNVFTIPDGLKELMADITREVLRAQPPNILDFIANYLSVLVITREHGVMAVKILDDLCDCKPSVSEHLIQLGFESKEAEMLATVIKEEIEGFEPVEGKEKLREIEILKKILIRSKLDEDISTKVCQVARNAYKDYWYRKKLMEKSLKVSSDEPWEIAAERTLEIYKKTKPSFSELTRATEKIQAAYRGYYVRRNLLRHLKPKKKTGPKVELPGPPLDIAASREIDLGPVIDIKVKEDDVGAMFEIAAGQKLGLEYDPNRTITHVIDDKELTGEENSNTDGVHSKAVMSPKYSTIESQMRKSYADAASAINATSKQSSIKQDEIPQSDFNTPSRRSRVSEAPPHRTRIPSLSFAKVPPEIINIDKEEDEDIPAPVLEELRHARNDIGFETPDVTSASDGETQDVPEDITVYTDGEESIPAASLPSSAPETDIEDTVAEVATGEEEI